MKRFNLFPIVLVTLALMSSCEKQDRFEPVGPEKMTKAVKAPLEVMATWPTEACGQRTYDLIAGQHIFAGSVHTIVEYGILYVQYEAAEGCKITEAHLFVGGEESVIPAGQSGNPKIGQFPYFWEGHGEEDIVTFSILLDELGLEEGDCLKIAAHAVVQCPNGEETAWATAGAVFAIKSYTNGGWAITGNEGNWDGNFRYYSVAEGLQGPIELVDSYGGLRPTGTVEVEEMDGKLQFTITPKEAPIYASSLFVGSIADFNTDYHNFDYIIGDWGSAPNWVPDVSNPEPIHIFEDIPMTAGYNFEGSRWGWYVIYCPVCE